MSFSSTQLNIAPGTLIDCLDPRMMVAPYSNIDAVGTNDNPITFRGCGYGQHRINFNGILVGNRPASSSSNQPTRFKYCNLIDPVGDFAIHITNTVTTAVPLILENNSSTNPNAIIKIGPTAQNLTISNIAYNEMDIHLSATAGNIIFAGTLHIPQNRTVYFTPYIDGAKYLFGNNTFLEIEGKIKAIGNSFTDKIIFDRANQSSYEYYLAEVTSIL